MRSTNRALVVALAGVTAASATYSGAAQGQGADVPRGVQIVQRFNGNVMVGKRTLHVIVEDVEVPNAVGTAEIRFGGAAVIEELAGKMQVQLAGKRLRVSENDVLEIPAGALLHARAVRSSAVFEAVVTSAAKGSGKP